MIHSSMFEGWKLAKGSALRCFIAPQNVMGLLVAKAADHDAELVPRRSRNGTAARCW